MPSIAKYQTADGISVSGLHAIKLEYSLIYLSGTRITTFLTMGGELICYCTKLKSNNNKTITIVGHKWGSGTRLSTPSREEVIKYWGKEMWQFERKDKSLLPSLSSQKRWKAATFVAGALLLSRPYATVVEWRFTKCEPSILQSNSARRKNNTWNCETVWQTQGIAYRWVPWRILVQARRRKAKWCSRISGRNIFVMVGALVNIKCLS